MRPKFVPKKKLLIIVTDEALMSCLAQRIGERHAEMRQSGWDSVEFMDNPTAAVAKIKEKWDGVVVPYSCLSTDAAAFVAALQDHDNVRCVLLSPSAIDVPPTENYASVSTELPPPVFADAVVDYFTRP